MIKTCHNCGKKFTTYPSRKSINCSMKCYDKTGNKNPKWRGGKILVDGYYYIYSPNHPNKTKMGYVAEHRLAMEKSIGRLLKKKEVVHHINRNTIDNGIENLILFASSGEHTKHEHPEERNYIGKFGVNSPNTHPNIKIKKSSHKEIIDMRSNGIKYVDIAKKFNVTISCINGIIRKHKILHRA